VSGKSDSFAFLFPGQGSQRVGMLAEAASAYPVVRATFDEASEALAVDLWELAAHGPEERLNLTEFTQPVLLSASVALWRAWQEQGGGRPTVLAGHSLGEFSALCCAGVFGLPDAVRIVHERGRAMQTAVPVGTGAMAAVLGLDDEVVMDACAAVSAAESAVVEAVNFNAPGQVVIAGHAGAVDAAIRQLRDAGAKRAMPLPVSAPFHTSLMQPAAERLAAVLDSVVLAAPAIPVVNNVDAGFRSEPEAIREALIRQIAAPVLWTRCMASVASRGVSSAFECGPGKVLGGLQRRIDKNLACAFLEQPADLHAAVTDHPAAA
jgi:[acyl-carrier-protein] S-malonyltransferase